MQAESAAVTASIPELWKPKVGSMAVNSTHSITCEPVFSKSRNTPFHGHGRYHCQWIDGITGFRTPTLTCSAGAGKRCENQNENSVAPCR